MKKIGLDFGHGGSDPGAVGRVLGLKEKDVVLDIGLEVKRLLVNNGFVVITTRETDTSLIPRGNLTGRAWQARELRARSALINENNCDIVLSIHINSFSSSRPDYYSTFVYKNDGEAGRLASLIQTEVVATTGWKDGRVREKNLHMVRETEMPAALAELGFISNSEQEKQLADSAFRKKLAGALAKAVCKYFGTEFSDVSDAQVKLMFDGKELNIEEPAILTEGRVLVPIRFIAEYLGYEVDWWEDEFLAVIGTPPTAKIPGEGIRIVINGRTVSSDVKSRLINRRIYLPIRFVAEALNFSVDWESSTSTVNITKKIKPSLDVYDRFRVITASEVKPELIDGYVKNTGVNSTFFDITSKEILGALVIDGKLISDSVSWRPPRTCFIKWKDGSYSIEKVSSVKTLKDVLHVTGGGPRLMPLNEDNDEDFEADIFHSRRERTAVGITSNGLIKLVTTDPMTLLELSELMGKLGCIKAMNLDGGNSTQMVFDNKIIQKGGRPVPVMLRVEG